MRGMTVPFHSIFGAASSSQLTAEFGIKRKSYFVMQNFVGPVCMFYTLSWVGLWVDVAAVPARAAIGIIPVLVTSNKISALSASLPPIGYSTRLGDFMSATLMFLTVHMLEFGIAHFAARWYAKLSK